MLQLLEKLLAKIIILKLLLVTLLFDNFLGVLKLVMCKRNLSAHDNVRAEIFVSNQSASNKLLT